MAVAVRPPLLHPLCYTVVWVAWPAPQAGARVLLCLLLSEQHLRQRQARRVLPRPGAKSISTLELEFTLQLEG